MIIEKAVKQDIDEVSELYFRVARDLEQNVNYPAWRSDLYPARETAEEAFEKGYLYVLRTEPGEGANNKIAATMILREESDPELDSIKWNVDADESEMFLLCTLAVSPDFKRMGLARKMVEFAIELAEKEGKKAIRLDVTQINEPATKLYKSFGFTYVGTIDSGEEYEETFGERYFDAYEKLI